MIVSDLSKLDGHSMHEQETKVFSVHGERRVARHKEVKIILELNRVWFQQADYKSNWLQIEIHTNKSSLAFNWPISNVCNMFCSTIIAVSS